MDSFVTIDEAAQIIKPGCISNAYNLCFRHVKLGNIIPRYPELFIVDPETGKIIQSAGKSKQMFFFKHEVEEYAQIQKKKNLNRGRNRPVKVKDSKTGIEKNYSSVKCAAKDLNLNYNSLYNSIRKKEKGKFKNYIIEFL